VSVPGRIDHERTADAAFRHNEGRGEPIMDGLLLTAVLPLAAFVLLTAGNAFFVAAEFGLVTVDRVEIDKRADNGDRQAITVRRALR
jgi:hypothetical protein